jgi:hypothetical protein
LLAAGYQLRHGVDARDFVAAFLGSGAVTTTANRQFAHNQTHAEQQVSFPPDRGGWLMGVGDG